jgi:hypothetical protein
VFIKILLKIFGWRHDKELSVRGVRPQVQTLTRK